MKNDTPSVVGTMMTTTFTVNDFIEVRVIAPGDDCPIYTFDPAAGGLRLSSLHRPSTPAPFDVAEVPGTALDETDNVPVWLIVHRSVFPGAIVTARPIGVLAGKDRASESRRVIAVPAADPQFEAILAPGDLPAKRRRALMEFACGNEATQEALHVRWEPAAAAHERIVFPFTGTGFKECFTALRRQMAIRFA